MCQGKFCGPTGINLLLRTQKRPLQDDYETDVKKREERKKMFLKCTTAVYALTAKSKSTLSGAFKFGQYRDSPSGKTPDGVFLQAGLAVFAFRATPVRLALKQKHRCAFRTLTRIKQFMRLLPNQKSTLSGAFKFGQYRVRTCDLPRVRRTRYRCANCPKILVK